MNLSKRSILYIVIGLNLFVSPSLLEAYVLKGPHLVQLMIDAINLPRTLSVNQILFLYEIDSESILAEYPQSIIYRMPEEFRSDIKSDELHQIQIASFDRWLTLIDDRVVAESEAWQDYYKDIFFYQSRDRLTERLQGIGIDITATSLGRYKESLYYIIGAQYPDESVPQIWLKKDSFLPVRWIIQSGNAESVRREVLFNNWRQYNNSWYPTEIQFVTDDQMSRKIEVTGLTVNPLFSDNFFDIEMFKQKKLPSSDVQSLHQGKSEIAKEIEDFKKIFE